MKGASRCYDVERPHGSLGNLTPQAFALGVAARVQ